MFKESEDESTQDVQREKKPKVKYPLEVVDYLEGMEMSTLLEGIEMSTFLKGWAKQRYKEHSKHQPKVTMTEFRLTSNDLKHEYTMADGTTLKLFVNLEHRGRDGFRMNLKSKALSAEEGAKVKDAQLGTLNFMAVSKKDPNAPTLPRSAWLFMDMIHLIMLLSAYTKAEKSQIRAWFVEAKVFLSGMDIKI